MWDHGALPEPPAGLSGRSGLAGAGPDARQGGMVAVLQGSILGRAQAT